MRRGRARGGAREIHRSAPASCRTGRGPDARIARSEYDLHHRRRGRHPGWRDRGGNRARSSPVPIHAVPVRRRKSMWYGAF